MATNALINLVFVLSWQYLKIARLNLLQQPIIIAMTASAMAEDKQACFSAGMDDYLSKPIELQKIMIALKRFYKKMNVGGRMDKR